MPAKKNSVSLKLQYNTRWGESLMVISQSGRYQMKWTPGNIWVTEVPAAVLNDYFYAVVEDSLITRLEWENHTHSLPASGEITDQWNDAPQGCPFPRKHTRSDFDRGDFRGAGVAVPVFSLRSENDFGIGEFEDLKPLVDWAASVGMCVIQLLPVNDTLRKGGWEDSYPYNPVSSFALHPLYANLQKLGIKADAQFRRKQAELNALPELDYPRVYKEKTKYLLKAYQICGEKDLKSHQFKAFAKDNEMWLSRYSAFCSEKNGIEAEFFAWLQFRLDQQFHEVAEYARSKGVSLKGDLPIGVSADSSEARYHPELFNLDCTAGAPPDFFSADGQNWGFPTYNWEAMAKNNYKWWKARLRNMNRYFDAFRIDHILGFFRIWEIPCAYSSGKMGHFNPAIPFHAREIRFRGLPVTDKLFVSDPRNKMMYHPRITPDNAGMDEAQQREFGAMYEDYFYHRHDEFWRRNAEKKLPELLSASGMLACGEDLGMIPDCVPGVMAHWSILSLEMPCMDKGRPWPCLSVCATSSHDMGTLRMQHGNPNSEECAGLLAESLRSDSMLAIFPIQDWIAISNDFRREDYEAERINEPAESNHHWCYRIHFNLEELGSVKAEPFREQVRNLILACGR